MPLCRNTCSANSRVYIAAAAIGHDKTSRILITDTPPPTHPHLCSIYGTPLHFPHNNTQSHTHAHSDLHYNRNKTFPGRHRPREKNTDKGQSCVFSLPATSLVNKSGMSSVIICSFCSYTIMALFPRALTPSLKGFKHTITCHQNLLCEPHTLANCHAGLNRASVVDCGQGAVRQGKPRCSAPCHAAVCVSILAISRHPPTTGVDSISHPQRSGCHRWYGHRAVCVCVCLTAV